MVFRFFRKHRTIQSPPTARSAGDDLGASPESIPVQTDVETGTSTAAELDPLIAAMVSQVIESTPAILNQFENSHSELRLELQQLGGTVAELAAWMQKAMEPVDFDVEYRGDTLDEQFAAFTARHLGKASPTATIGEIVDVTVIGELRNGLLAWVNPDRHLYGTVPMSDLHGMTPLPDDRIRARVASYPWGHILVGIVPNSLSSPFSTRPVPATTIHSAGVVPAGVKEELVNLRPGDIVLARIPYDGSGALNTSGRTGKARPAVFLNWENDYANVRAIYDRNGYVTANNLGTPLMATRDLDKPSVVRNAVYDIDPRKLFRRLGRLGAADLLALNIEDSPVPAPGNSPSPSHIPPPPAPPKVSTDPYRLRVPDIAEKARGEWTTTPGGLFRILMGDLDTHPTTMHLIRNVGVKKAVLGDLFTRIAREINLPLSTGVFASTCDQFLVSQSTHAAEKYVVLLDEHHLPFLRLIPHQESENLLEQPQPVDFSSIHDTGFVSLAIDDDLPVPDVIIYDMDPMADLLGDERLDLRETLVELQLGGEAPGYLVGTINDIGSQSFTKAARDRGWKTPSVMGRENIISEAVRLCQSHGAEFVTVVSPKADIVAALENEGFEVAIINALV